MTTGNLQFIRKASLVVTKNDKGLDLSQMRFKFSVRQNDEQSPNNCSIRVYNLSPETVTKVKDEFSEVMLAAGYDDPPGQIFSGTIKQFKTGRENATDTYLDIFAADSDIGYNLGVINQPFAAGATPQDQAKAAANAMGVKFDLNYAPTLSGLESKGLPRSKVGWGMARALTRGVANSNGTTWSIQNGTLQMTPLDGYLPGEALQVNQATGMIGIPEQTNLGVKVRSLLNPKIRIGGLIELNGNDITQSQFNSVVPFDQWAGLISSSVLAANGLYRAYSVEHEGDTRGNEWYSDLICLSIDRSSKKVTNIKGGP